VFIKKIIMSPSFWSDASANYKQQLRNRLGNQAYNEFLHHARPDLSLEVINDWWDWSIRESRRKGLQYVLQELIKMVCEYDPVYWSDDIVPSPPPSHFPSDELAAQSFECTPFRFENADENFHISSNRMVELSCGDLCIPDFEYQSMQNQFSLSFDSSISYETRTFQMRSKGIKRFRPSFQSRNLYIRPFRHTK
jgi:hypothetical protein